MNLTGKRVLVTGGNRGLGLAVVKAMATAGAEVFAWGRDQEVLAEAAESLKEMNLAGSFHRVDVRDEPAVVAAVEAMGPVDVLVNNAGIVRTTPALETPTRDFEDVLETNVTAAFVVTREIARGMVANGSGLIINVASDAAIMGFGRAGAYCASKRCLAWGGAFPRNCGSTAFGLPPFVPGQSGPISWGRERQAPTVWIQTRWRGFWSVSPPSMPESRSRSCWPNRCRPNRKSVPSRRRFGRDRGASGAEWGVGPGTGASWSFSRPLTKRERRRPQSARPVSSVRCSPAYGRARRAGRSCPSAQCPPP